MRKSWRWVLWVYVVPLNCALKMIKMVNVLYILLPKKKVSGNFFKSLTCCPSKCSWVAPWGGMPPATLFFKVPWTSNLAISRKLRLTPDLLKCYLHFTGSVGFWEALQQIGALKLECTLDSPAKLQDPNFIVEDGQGPGSASAQQGILICCQNSNCSHSWDLPIQTEDLAL